MIQAIITDCFGVMLLSQQSRLAINRPYIDWLREQAAAGVRLYMITNDRKTYIEPAFAALDASQDLEIFEHIEYCADREILKPSLAAFANVMTADEVIAGCEPESLLFIDDGAANVDTAHSIGMQAIVFENTEQAIDAANTLMAG